MECHTVDDRNKKQRPVRPTLCNRDIVCIIDWEEDMGCSRKVGKSFFKGERIRRLHEHECHGGSEEDDVRRGVLGELFVLEVSKVFSGALLSS